MSSGPNEGLITKITLTRRSVIHDIKNKYDFLCLESSPPSLLFFLFSPNLPLAPNNNCLHLLTSLAKKNSNFYKISNTSLKTIRTLIFFL